jgi:hypothetical protein
MAGTYLEQELVIGPIEVAGRLSAASEIAAGRGETAALAPDIVGTITKQGAWYAIWLDEPLV